MASDRKQTLRSRIRLAGGPFFQFFLQILAQLPSQLAYGMALAYGDLSYRLSPLRGEATSCVELIFGSRFSPKERETIVRNQYRIRSCEVVDMTRLRGDGKKLLSFVEVRGLENLRDALAAGRGAVACSAHFTRREVTAFSVIGALGFPIAIIARWSSETDFRLHHFSRPNIERKPGNLSIAVQAATVLRNNGLVGIMIDHAVRRGDDSRAFPFDFLGRKAMLAPGASTIAQVTGSPLVVASIYRARDWRHLVLEISSPVQIQGNPLGAFQKCLDVVEATIWQNPAQWTRFRRSLLTAMGLMPNESADGRRLVDTLSRIQPSEEE